MPRDVAARSLGVPGMHVHLPSLEFLQEIYGQYPKGKVPRLLNSELIFKGDLDDSVACPDHYPLSLFSLFLPFQTTEKQLVESCEATLGAMGLEALVGYLKNGQVLTPRGIQDRWGMYKGSLDHLQMKPDLLFAARTDFVTSGIENLRICGSSRSPGGLVSGYPALEAVAETVAV